MLWAVCWLEHCIKVMGSLLVRVCLNNNKLPLIVMIVTFCVPNCVNYYLKTLKSPQLGSKFPSVTGYPCYSVIEGRTYPRN